MHRGCAAPDASLGLWGRGSARGWGTGTMEGVRERRWSRVAARDLPGVFGSIIWT